MFRLFSRSAALKVLSLAVLLALAGCQREASDVLGQAYVAPSALSVRRQLTQKGSPVATLKHGDRVSIIDVRRRFVKVRTSVGVEGWVDSADLLSPAEMDRIRHERKQARLLPSEGSATVFEALNIHIDPGRRSPAFAQIPEGASVTILRHQLEPKTSGPERPPSLITERPQTPSRKQHKEGVTKTNKYLPPMPAPPKPPENWQELSSERIPGAQSAAEIRANKEAQEAAKKRTPPKPVAMEDWSLVRTKDDQFGWVLSRNLVMSIPDEVAQYAEGKRITSYFDLGAVNDDQKGIRHNWLWTTLSGLESYDFDGWRVFLWNRRRHRYETSYRQRDLEGYFPVHVDPPDANAFGRTFELITRDDDGKFRRRSYLFDGTRVHLTGTENYNPTGTPATNAGTVSKNLPLKTARPNWFQRQWNTLRSLVGHR